MKKYFAAKYLFVVSVISLFALGGCKKENDDTVTPDPVDTTHVTPVETYPAPISNTIPQSMIDSLRAAGTLVYSGTNPPIINGIYLMSPDSCIYDNGSASAGTIYADYKFRFSNQDNSAFTVTVDQKNMVTGVLNTTPISSYICGSGNNFTVFILRTLSPLGIEVEQYNVLSGTLTANGVQNFQNTLYMRSKGADPNNTVVHAGTIRVFVTGGSGLAASQTIF